MKVNLVSNSVEETIEIAHRLGLKLFRGAVITIEGVLGAGKTHFAKGVAKGLNIDAIITSPTFVIVKFYDSGRIPFFHIDAYRLEGVGDDGSISEYINSDGVALIEWSKFIASILPSEKLQISINIDLENGSRQIKIEATGHNYENLLKDVDLHEFRIDIG